MKSQLSIPHPLDMSKKIIKQTIHSLCSPLSVPHQQKNSLGIPLSSTNKQRSLYNPLNVELCSTIAKELSQFTLQLYHYSLRLVLHQSTSQHATIHTQINQPSRAAHALIVLPPRCAYRSPQSCNLGGM